MLDKALGFIKNQLEEYLSIQVEDEDILKFSTLKGTATDSLQTNKLIVTIVNIEEEESMAHRNPHIKTSNGIIKKNSPVYLNIYILFSVNFKDKFYLKGLNILSLIISFFQQHSAFDGSQYALPEHISKLNFELVNIKIENMSHFWGALGANYQPSVIYKMRMLSIDAQNIITKETEINEPNIHGKL